MEAFERLLENNPMRQGFVCSLRLWEDNAVKCPLRQLSRGLKLVRGDNPELAEFNGLR
ncbi:hypothetical protein PNA2_1067 [Pyrococcus sp. NA2]|nr:hypothetical protein PNA2_1067 [Pyrococcus sp. NA2]